MYGLKRGMFYISVLGDGILKNIKLSYLIIIMIILLFLMFSLTINVVSINHEKEYLSSYPDDNNITMQITYDVTRVRETGSAGSDWRYEHFLNDKQLIYGEILTVDVESPLFITSRITDLDKINDVGEATSETYASQIIKCNNNILTISHNVHVDETGGRSNAGSTTDFNVVYGLKRVVPQSMNFWNMYWYTSNNLGYIFCVLPIVGQIACISILIFIIIKSIKKKAQIKPASY